ncbi:MAG: outer membrane beta-barrel domain-containing protein, partial [Gammaproteobacteria bacterium]|nr:outer membrane beta-barrel domain-containing protein [Gammaproteobacteria bacterium]
METGLRVLLLTVLLTVLTGCATVRGWFHRGHASAPTAQTDSDDEANPPRVVEPEVARRKITVPKIRSRNLEFGLDYGALSIEDFGTHPSYGALAAYHITEDFFFQAEVGRSKAGRTSFETLNGNVQLLTESERRFTFYDLSLG